MMRFVISLVLVLLLLSTLVGAKRNKHRGNEKYIGNPKDTYPHIHIGKGFAVLSRGRHDHVRLKSSSGCSRARRYVDKYTKDGRFSNLFAAIDALNSYC